MSAWPIGLSTGCFYQQSILHVLDRISASGFHEIEICSYPRHLDYHNFDEVCRAGERIGTLGLRPCSFHAPFAPHIDITAPDERMREQAVQELLTACRAAAALRAEQVVLHPGPEQEGRPPEEEFFQRMQHAAAALKRVAAECRDLGVKLLLENMLPHLLFGRPSDMMYLLGEVGDSAVGVCLDTGHALLGGNLGTVLHLLSGHLKMVHVNDNHGDRDAHLPPGEGCIAWLWFLESLEQQKFNGSLILEIASLANEPVEDTLARARRGRQYLEQLCQHRITVSTPPPQQQQTPTMKTIRSHLATATDSPSDTGNIRLLAYELWMQAGCPAGKDLHFWLEAERQIDSLPLPASCARKSAAKPSTGPLATSRAGVAKKSTTAV